MTKTIDCRGFRGGAHNLSFSTHVDYNTKLIYNSNMEIYKQKKAFTQRSRWTRHIGCLSNGFTLAEVLITLAIIGVVAAMTIPTLISNYQQKALDNQFKKSYSMLNQILLNTRAQYDYLPRCYHDTGGSLVSEDCNDFREKFYSGLKIAKTCNNKAFEKGCIPEYKGIDDVLKENHKNDEDYDEDYWQDYATRNCGGFNKNMILNNKPAYVLSDGTIIFTHYNSGIPSLIAVDINGMKGPNKWGYDLFSFMVVSDGNYFKYVGAGCMAEEKGGVRTNQKIYEVFNK